MSLTTILLAFAPGIAARINRPAINADVEITRLKEQVADLTRELEAERAQSWRNQPIVTVDAPQPAGPDFRPPEYAQAQALNWRAQQAHAQAQYHQQMAAQQMNAVGYQQDLIGQLQGLQQGHLLGAQSLEMPGEWCNCVPARHDMFLPRR
jgi:hypothetical protein